MDLDETDPDQSVEWQTEDHNRDADQELGTFPQITSESSPPTNAGPFRIQRIPSSEDTRMIKGTESMFDDTLSATQIRDGTLAASTPNDSHFRLQESSSPVLPSSAKNGMTLPSLGELASSSPATSKSYLEAGGQRVLVNKLKENPGTSLTLDNSGNVRIRFPKAMDGTDVSTKHVDDEGSTQLVQASPNAVANLVWGAGNDGQDPFAQVMGTPRQELVRRREQAISASGELDVIRSDDEEEKNGNGKSHKELVHDSRVSTAVSRQLKSAKSEFESAVGRQKMFENEVNEVPETIEEDAPAASATQPVNRVFEFTQPLRGDLDAAQSVNMIENSERLQNTDGATQPVNKTFPEQFDDTLEIDIDKPAVDEERTQQTYAHENLHEVVENTAKDHIQKNHLEIEKLSVSETPARSSRLPRPGLSTAMRAPNFTRAPPTVLETPAHQIGTRSKRGRVVPSTSPNYTPLLDESAIRSTRRRKLLHEEPAISPTLQSTSTGVISVQQPPAFSIPSKDSEAVELQNPMTGGKPDIFQIPVDDKLKYNGNGAWLAWNDRKWYAAELAEGQLKNIVDDGSLVTKVFTYTATDTKEEVDVDVSSLRQLDLDVGDIVRVEGKGNKEFEVMDLVRSDSDDKRIVLHNGVDAATLKLRPTRSQKSKKTLSSGVITFPIHKLYLTPKMVQVYLERRGKDTNVFNQVVDLFTVRKAKQTAMKEVEPLSTRTSVTASPAKSRIFQGCLFTISGFDTDAPIFSDIVLNGGVVLDSLQDLFKVHYSSTCLTLEWDAKQPFRFGGVIAKSGPLRTAKYLEALALGWPCLSAKFIENCLESKRFLGSWDEYVFAAGRSEVLDGYLNYDVGRFRELWLQNVSLEQQFHNRKRLLVDPVYVVKHGDFKKNPVGFALLAISEKVMETVGTQSVASNCILVDSKDSRPFGKNSATEKKGKEWVIQVLINRRRV